VDKRHGVLNLLLSPPLPSPLSHPLLLSSSGVSGGAGSARAGGGSPPGGGLLQQQGHQAQSAPPLPVVPAARPLRDGPPMGLAPCLCCLLTRMLKVPSASPRGSFCRRRIPKDKRCPHTQAVTAGAGRSVSPLLRSIPLGCISTSVFLFSFVTPFTTTAFRTFPPGSRQVQKCEMNDTKMM